MSTVRVCPFCNAPIDPFTLADCATHATSAHPFTAGLVLTYHGSSRTATPADQAAINGLVYQGAGTAPRASQRPVNPAPTVIQDMAQRVGIIMDDALTMAPVSSTDGGRCSERQIEEFFRTCDDAAKWAVNRTAAFTNFAWVVTNLDATDEVKTLGSLHLSEQLTAGSQARSTFVTFETILTLWEKRCEAEKLGKPTFRQLARAFAQQIWNLIRNSEQFRNRTVNGTTISQQYSIDQQYFYAVLSFFPAMKDPSTWTVDEAAAYEAHRSQVTKTARGSSANTVSSLKIDPMASAAAFAAYNARLKGTGIGAGQYPNFASAGQNPTYNAKQANLFSSFGIP